MATPINNTVYTTQPTASGNAADNGGSGLAPTTVHLYRYATATVTAGYWAGGTTWNTTYSSANDIPASGAGTWSLTLPTLTNGNYAVEAVAWDKAGNSTISPLAFFSMSAGTSTVSISTPSATATNNTLTLPFTGALDATVANDISRYSVIKSGTSIAIQSASYNATTKTVTLNLAAGALTAGTLVKISWTKLFDTTGKIITGSSSVTP